jgi:hypothetical protein
LGVLHDPESWNGLEIPLVGENKPIEAFVEVQFLLCICFFLRYFFVSLRFCSSFVCLFLFNLGNSDLERFIRTKKQNKTKKKNKLFFRISIELLV